MRALVILALNFNLVLAPLSTAFAGSGDYLAPGIDRATAENKVFEALRDRVYDSHSFNLAQATLLEKCLNGEEAQNSAPCQGLLNFVQKTIRTMYPKMRQYQFMINLVSGRNFRNLQGRFSEQLGQFAIHSSQVVEQSPTFMFLQDNPLNDAVLDELTDKHSIQNAPFRAEEIQSILRNDVNFKITMQDFQTGEVVERPYPLTFDGHLQLLCDRYLTEDVAKMCRQVHLTFNAVTGNFNFAVDKDFAGDPIDLGRRLWALELGMGELYMSTQDMTRRFYELVQMYPFVALVPSAEPTTQELLNMARVIRTSAQNSLNRFLDYYNRSKINRTSRNEDLDLFDYAPIVQDILDHPTAEMKTLSKSGVDFNEVVNGHYEPDKNGKMKETVSGLMDEHHTQQKIKAGTHIAEMIGANIAVCAIPWEKALAIAGKVGQALRAAIRFKRGLQSISLLCFPVSNVFVNFGTSVFNVLDYIHTYDEVFGFFDSSSDPLNGSRRHFVREVHDLSSQQRMFFWNIVVAGVFSAGSLKKTATIVKSQFLEQKVLSKESADYFESQLALSGGTP